MKPFLRFVGTILRKQIAEIPGEPRFCVKRVLFFVFFDFPEESERISETLARNLKNSFRVRERVFQNGLRLAPQNGAAGT